MCLLNLFPDSGYRIIHNILPRPQFLKKNIESVVAAHGATADTNEWMNMINQESAKLIPDNNRLRTMGRCQ